MSNIYAAPEAELGNVASGERVGGNIEDAIAGNIEISMTGTMGEAWRRLKGFKTVCLLACLLYVALAFATNFINFPVILGLMAVGADENSAALIGSLIQVVISVAILPVFIGIHILGMRHAEQRSTTSTAIFAYFNKVPALFLCYFIMIVMIMLGTLLLVLPGIYLMFAYMFSMHLVVEKNIPAWRALEISRKAISKVWFRFVGLYFLIIFVNLLAAIPLLIGLIWTVPWSVLTLSMVYNQIFGAEAHTLAD
jgi:hypothetical protein